MRLSLVFYFGGLLSYPIWWFSGRPGQKRRDCPRHVACLIETEDEKAPPCLSEATVGGVSQRPWLSHPDDRAPSTRVIAVKAQDVPAAREWSAQAVAAKIGYDYWALLMDVFADELPPWITLGDENKAAYDCSRYTGALLVKAGAVAPEVRAPISPNDIYLWSLSQ